jgi:hypothetical protein
MQCFRRRGTSGGKPDVEIRIPMETHSRKTAVLFLIEVWMFKKRRTVKDESRPGHRLVLKSLELCRIVAMNRGLVKVLILSFSTFTFWIRAFNAQIRPVE